MGTQVLITGGAGFIGSHLADELLAHGHRVRVLDSLIPQVHGPERRRPAYLHPEVELIVGDVCSPTDVRGALAQVDVVFHFAALVGVGQSMYELARYAGVNGGGTAVLLEALIERPVAKLIVASSMSLYGEGLYGGTDDTRVTDARRTPLQLAGGDWEPRGRDGRPLSPLPTDESKPPDLASVYALSKFDQERLCLLVGGAYHIPTLALRFFNVYGTRQSLSNPYTGVLAIFASRLLNGRPPLVYEDGLQQRDFVHVRDVVRACRLALDRPAAGVALNIGSGQPLRIVDIARRLGSRYGGIEPLVTGRHRRGDIRHCYADISAARTALGYEPCIDFDLGVDELVDRLDGAAAVDRVEEAHAELSARGLTV